MFLVYWTLTKKKELASKYVIVERTEDFTNDIYHCSCGEQNCLHVQEISALAPPSNDSLEDNTDVFEYVFLTDDLIGIYVERENSYSILKQTPKIMTCLKCVTQVRSCVHVKAYKEYIPNSEANIRPSQTFKSISTEEIAYPFDDNDVITCSRYARGVAYPTHLRPSYDPVKRCEHGFPFSKEDKYLQAASLHLGHNTLECVVYYKPALGSCNCKQYYDGRSDLLLNLETIVYFGCVNIVYKYVN